MTTSPTAAERRALEALVALALEEDVGEGDWTTRWTVPEGSRSSGRVVAKEDLVVAGTWAFGAVVAAVDADVSVEPLVDDGARVHAGDTVLRVEGPSRALLTAERTALNFLGRLSGIATVTRRFVDAVRGTGARIVDTRKTTPGWRVLEKGAVRAGGGTNHRFGLWDMVLVKENHAVAAGGLEAALAGVRAHDERGLLVEVEVRSMEELRTVLPAGPDRILLDNMTPEELTRAVAVVREDGAARPVLEASGNVSLETVRDVARTGVDLVSVGALTHSAPVADLSLLLDG